MGKMRNKIGVYIYMDPDTYRVIENIRNPAVPRSSFYSMALEEVFGINRP